jgi:valyl-tRNA synthetase
MRYTLAEMATELQDVRMPVEYRCPHCHGLTLQTAVVPREKRPSDITKVNCGQCKKPFATQWANEELKNELGVALETSDRFEAGRNLCNKLWNAARFAFMNLDGVTCDPLEVTALPPEDRWILAELSRVVRQVNDLMSRYQFSTTAKTLREFFWDSLCDWYIELTKPRMAPDAPPDRQGPAAKQVLAFCLDQVLRLFHPFMPFLTEKLWQQLNAIAPQRGLPGVADLEPSELLIHALFPPADGWAGLDNEEIIGVFKDLQNATRGVRDLRSRCNVSPKQRVTVTISAPSDHAESLRGQAHIIQEMAGIESLTVVTEAIRPKNAATTLVGGLRIIVHDVSDDEAERKRVERELANVNKQIAGKESKLANEKFVQNARPEVVEAERRRLADFQAQRATLQRALDELS